MVVVPRQAFAYNQPSSSCRMRVFYCAKARAQKGKRSFALQRIRTIEVRSHVGERVRVAGWLHSLRQMGGINFLVMRDGWGALQAVAEAETETEIAPLVESGAGVESVLA